MTPDEGSDMEGMKAYDPIKSIDNVIGSLQLIMSVARSNVIRARRHEDIRDVKYWQGRYDATYVAFGHVSDLQEQMMNRSPVKKSE